MSAWFGSWDCGCTGIARTVLGIPEHCPTHGEPLISDNAGRTKVPLTHSGVSGYGIRDKDANPASRDIAERESSE